MVTQTPHHIDSSEPASPRCRHVFDIAFGVSMALLQIVLGIALAEAARHTETIAPLVGWLTVHPLRPVGASLLIFGLYLMASSLITSSREAH